ncbi:MAG: transcriptional regulator [Herpetosiphonaceae bacterium]|nr:MAG: transcriptional regulator [Herpetosiphonaceae bacterium]
MHRTEFVREVARKTGLPMREVSKVINTSLDVIAETLRGGEKVVLTGFGTFEMRSRQERQGVNPKTRERITIGATRTPGFTASTTLKNAVRNGGEA